MNKLIFAKLDLDTKKNYVNSQINSIRVLFNQVCQAPECSAEIKSMIDEVEKLLENNALEFVAEKELLKALNLYLLYLEQKINPTQQLLITRELNNCLDSLLSDDDKKQKSKVTAEEWQRVIPAHNQPINARKLLIFIYQEINAHSANLIKKCTDELADADFDFEKLSQLMTFIEENDALIFESDRQHFLDIKINCRKKLANLLFLRIKEDASLIVPSALDEIKVNQLKESYAFLLSEYEEIIELEKLRVASLNDQSMLMQTLNSYSAIVEAYMRFLLLVQKNSENDLSCNREILSFYNKAIKEKINHFNQSVNSAQDINEILPYFYLAALVSYNLACKAPTCDQAGEHLDEFLKVVHLYEPLIAKSSAASQCYAGHFVTLRNLKFAVVNDASPSRKFAYYIKDYDTAKKNREYQQVVTLGDILIRCIRQMDSKTAQKHSMSNIYVDMADAHIKLDQHDLAVENLICALRRGYLSVDDQNKLLKIVRGQLEKNPCNHRTAFLRQALTDYRVRHSTSAVVTDNSSQPSNVRATLYATNSNQMKSSSAVKQNTTGLVANGDATLSGNKRTRDDVEHREPTPDM